MFANWVAPVVIANEEIPPAPVVENTVSTDPAPTVTSITEASVPNTPNTS